MRLDLGIMAGAESKAWLADLSKIVERMEKAAEIMSGASSAAKTSVDVAPAVDTGPLNGEDDDLEKPAKTTKAARAPAKSKKAAASFDDEEETQAAPVVEEESEDDGDLDFSTPPAKTAKATKEKKYTSAEVNDACKARAIKIGGKAGRAEVLAILKKKFKTESVTELKPEQYAAVIAAMEA